MSLLKWAQNSIGMGKSSNSNSSSSSPVNSASKTNGNNNMNGSSIGVKWVHSSETLQKQGIVYVVKFLGNLIVEQTNGIDVVKEAIRKLEFSRQLRKSEAGSSATKLKKVELHVSIDKVAIQELKTHQVLHQYPLHRISYCADDKGEKNFFAFIAKNQSISSSSNNANDNDTIDTKAKLDTKVTASAQSTHEIFVFISNKQAEEITVTIGQAFDLAYKKFLENSGNDELNIQRRLLIAQQQIQRLELENNIFKQRLLDLSHLNGVSNYMNQLQLKSIIEVPKMNLSKTLPSSSSSLTFSADNSTNGNLIDTKSDDDKNTIIDNQKNRESSKESLVSLAFPMSVKSNDFVRNSVSANKSSSLVDNDDDFDPRFYEKNADQNDNHNNVTPLLAPPPSSSKSSKRALTNFSEISTKNNNNSPKVDIFGMHNFQTNQIENPITLFDNELLEMEKAFSRGLSLGNEDFSLESLDPLKN